MADKNNDDVTSAKYIVYSIVVGLYTVYKPPTMLYTILISRCYVVAMHTRVSYFRHSTLSQLKCCIMRARMLYRAAKNAISES